MSPVRLRLKTSMAIILALALLFAWVRTLDRPPYALALVGQSPWIWVMASIGSFLFARADGRTIRARSRRIGMIFTTILLSIALTYVFWAHYRSTHQSFWLAEGFPYPDHAILALERWFHARHPLLTPGSIKMHGEFPRVRITLGSAVLILATLDGLLVGFLSNRVRQASDTIEF